MPLQAQSRRLDPHSHRQSTAIVIQGCADRSATQVIVLKTHRVEATPFVRTIAPNRGIGDADIEGRAQTQPSDIGRYPQLPAQYREMGRLEEHTSEIQSRMRISYAVFC